MIRALIVDDVDLARESIRLRLRRHRDVTVVAEAANGPDALAAIEKLAPDVIFLDVRMPGGDGFDVLESTRLAPRPAVVFVTAYDEFAVKAFTANAQHYLLKPIDDDQFDEALMRVRHSLARRASSITAPGARTYLERIVIKEGERYRVLKTGGIEWIESAGNYVQLHAGGRPYTTRRSLKDMEEDLDPAQFARVSKSIVVNLDSILEIRKLWHGDFEILLRDRARVRLSRRYRARVLPRS